MTTPADDVRDQLLHAIDFNYAAGLGYGTPEELLAAYDASRTPSAADQAVLRDRIADVLAAADGWIWVEDFDKTKSPAYQGYLRQADAVLAVLPPADRAAARDALRRADEAEARAAAMESTAADALKHQGCHRELMAQCQRAERAEAEVKRLRTMYDAATARENDLIEERDKLLEAPADRAAEVEKLRTKNERMRHELEVMYGGAFDSPDIAAADNPTPLRWGLDDVLHGDDDTTTILLSGPTGEPYWLELEPERTAALRDALAGPGDSSAKATALDVLRALADPEACAWEGVYCVTHSWRSETGRCPHGQAQALINGGTVIGVLPRRGDAFERWLKAQRDEHRDTGRGVWTTLDNLLDAYRLHADTGTPLGEHVCEGQAVGDCECLEQPVTGARDGAVS